MMLGWSSYFSTSIYDMNWFTLAISFFETFFIALKVFYFDNNFARYTVQNPPLASYLNQ